MNVVLSTPGKFHFFDLARQMQAQSSLTRMYTGYPSFKLKNEQLLPALVHPFPVLLTPYMLMARYHLMNVSFNRNWYWMHTQLFDAYAAATLPDCDVFMGLSGASLRTGKRAQKKGAVYVCDRPCTHIRYQHNLVMSEYKRQGLSWEGVDPRVIAFEEAEYAAADAIVVASTFSKQSFVEMGVDENKIYQIPYGVDLSRFQKSGEPDPERFDVLFAGAAAVRKGIHDLLDGFAAVSHPNKKLTFVGSISPDVRPLIDRYSHEHPIECLGHIEQSRLQQIMSKSSVLVLPSIEDGFGLVLGQAMACGCPVIGTTNTGTQDMITDGLEGYVVPIRNPEQLTERLQYLADNYGVRQKMSDAALVRVQSMGGWTEYGNEMLSLFTNLSNPAVSNNRSSTQDG